MDNIDRTVIANRGRFYSCSEDDFFTPGTTFRHSESLDGENLIYLTKIYDRTFISAGLNNISI